MCHNYLFETLKGFIFKVAVFVLKQLLYFILYENGSTNLTNLMAIKGIIFRDQDELDVQ
jgi:hypothetical protein